MKVLILILGSIFLFLVLLRSFEEYSIYFPSPYPQGRDWNPTRGEDRFVEVQFQTEDHETLHGWWYPSRTTETTYLWFHGNAGNVTFFRENVEYLRDIPVQIFFFDYRGYGKSTGIPSEEGLYRDGRAAYDFVRDHFDISSNQLLLLGQSLGGAIATSVAEQKDCAGLILESTFTSIRELTRATLSIPYLDRFFETEMNTMGRIQSVDVPLLLLHGTLDETVPIELGKKLYRHASEPKKFEEFEQAFHFDLMTSEPERYLQCHRGFVQNVIS